MALVVVTAGVWFGYQRLTAPSCSGALPLVVSATPEIAPAVQAAADRWRADSGAVGDTCVAVEVTASDPVDVAAVVAGQHGVALAGVGQASGTAIAPDVWVPDSSTWLLRLSSLAPGFTPANNESVARSPVVVAMPEPVATNLGWPDQQLTWTDLLQQITTGTELRTGIVEPTRDAAGLSGLLALGEAAGEAGANAQQATTAALRALATGRSALREDLIARFPRSADPASVASALGAAALSEEDVIEYNAAQPPIALAALYLEPAPMSLDYPYAVLPGADPAKAAAAAGFYSVLTGAGFRERLGDQGLRAPDGTWGAGFSAPQGAPSPAGTAPATVTPDSGGTAAGGLDPVVIDRTLATWTSVTLPAQMLAVIDVSGSMLEPVPTADNVTRADLTREAARRGLGLFDDSWALGLWIFSTELDGEQDWRELVPISPLSSRRAELEASLSEVVPKRNGNTGLYDTTLAAYLAVQDEWAAGRVNSVVIFTDGRNEDDSGLTQDELLAELAEAADPQRPIQVIYVGIGDGVSQEELESITNTTGGGVFVTEDPANIGDILLKAIALRPTTVR
ncbi:von Willebrand factor type A domain-containing protein [Micromonospora sp. Llam0]|uniref:substrate-binding domain-containing protein n=1 Tax=Micromonospora sp. Llam0 TaxID=2485143 RepID=UPI000FA09F43|nr:substrate-binding domain-containing protein [Micromonospora sp. Llam0]ROO58459.1 von Willebrand factor type A domain-containing protein [Micromonospora sp. Llam0]